MNPAQTVCTWNQACSSCFLMNGILFSNPSMAAQMQQQGAPAQVCETRAKGKQVSTVSAGSILKCLRNSQVPLKDKDHFI